MNKNIKHLVVAYNCHPTMGSEEAVGWCFSRIHAEYADTTIYTQARYATDIIESPQVQLEAKCEFLSLGFLDAFLPRIPFGMFLHYMLWHSRVYLKLRSKNEKFDICHVTTWVAAIYPVLSLFIPAKHTLWGPVGGVGRAPHEFYCKHRYRSRLKERLRSAIIAGSAYNPLLHLCYANCSHVIAAADDGRKWLSDNGFASFDRVSVIPGIVCPDSLLDEIGQDPKMDDRTLQLVVACRMLGWKGVDMLIEAAARVQRRDFLISVYGDGEDRHRLQRLIDEYGVSQVCQLRGRVSRVDLLRKVQSSDAFILPSLHDSEAGACMEAASLGVPVVTTSFGGVASCLKDCDNVQILRAQTRESMVAELAELIEKWESRKGVARQSNIPAQSILRYEAKKEKMSSILSALYS